MAKIRKPRNPPCDNPPCGGRGAGLGFSGNRNSPPMMRRGRGFGRKNGKPPCDNPPCFGKGVWR
jgi:hypothetical protein